MTDRARFTVDWFLYGWKEAVLRQRIQQERRDQQLFADRLEKTSWRTGLMGGVNHYATSNRS